MSYFIKAYNKGSKINIPIEDKHKYDTKSESREYYTFDQYSPLYPIKLLPYTAAYASGSGYKAVYASATERNFQSIWRGFLFSTSRGTEEFARIGNKIYLKSMSMMINIYMTESSKRFFNCNYVNYTDLNTDGSSLNGWTNHLKEESQTPAKFKFRMMLVKFDSDMNAEAIRDWFNGIYVPQYYVGSSTEPAITNQSKLLRESTSYTGKFNILYDKPFTINSKKGHKFINFHYKFKRNLNFDDSTNRPSDDDFNRTQLIIFGPTLLVNDMDGHAYSKMSDYMEKTQSLTAASTLRNYVLDAFQVTYNAKYKFYDI